MTSTDGLGGRRNTWNKEGRDEDIPTSLLPPSLQVEDDRVVKLKSNEVRIGPMTRARAKLLKEQVNLFLSDTLIDENFILPKSYYLCMIRYEEGASIARGGEEQLDKKMDVKLDMELDKKTSHGRAREEREACARGGDVRAACPVNPTGRSPARPGRTGSHAGPARSKLGPTLVPAGSYLVSMDARPVDIRSLARSRPDRPENKNSADIITWREYEALRNEMRREFRTQDDELRGTFQGISQKLDATSETVTTMKDRMTDIQRSLQALQLAVENLTQQQQQEEDEAEDEAPNANRGAGHGHRGRGFVELGRPGRGFEEEDGLGKPKLSIPKFEAGADVEEYLSWELKIEKLWRLHNYTEDRKIKLASSEFDGYALRWWDGLVRAREEDGELPIITWRAMKAAMQARFVSTNYLRTIYDKLTLLRQGVKIVDEYYMEMEMLMQRGRVLESLEMTMQRFLNGLKSCYGSWALHASGAPTYGVGAIYVLRTLLYSV
ncbi:hypothetical protein QYE76_069255 [Lolium multiflorum]|uniref:Retrotransposon gag domain-containing protein n=1 Tax=Lolium multiflorum TaxID=4521 RepID=A0AAD8SI90_LOLMU|nr:hypothetical protein QYE76_069255 [Lolium multiflorum]